MLNPEEKLDLISTCSALCVGTKEAFREFAIAKCINDIRGGKWDNKDITIESIYEYVSDIYDNSYRITPQNFEGEVNDKNMTKDMILNTLKHVRLTEYEHRLFKYPLKRYSFCNNIFTNNYGFEVEDIIDFSNTLCGLIKMDFRMKYTHYTEDREAFERISLSPDSRLPLPSEHVIKNWIKAISYEREDILRMLSIMNCLNGFEQSLMMDIEEMNFDDVKDVEDIEPLEKIENILDLSILDESQLDDSGNLIYNNPLRYKPILSFDDKILVPVPFLLSELPTSLCYNLGLEVMGSGKFRHKSGKAFEELVATEFKYIFGKNNVERGKHYNKHKGNPDVDILVNWRDKVIVGECTTVHLPKEFHKNTDVLFRVLDNSIKKCYEQVMRAKNKLKEDPDIFNIQNKPEKIYPIIITEIPLLAFNPKQFNIDYLRQFMKEDQMAYGLDIFSLQTILNKCYDAKEFIDFLEWRLDSMNIKQLSNFSVVLETDSFVYFRIYGDRFARKITRMVENFRYTGDIKGITSDYRNKNRLI